VLFAGGVLQRLDSNPWQRRTKGGDTRQLWNYENALGSVSSVASAI